MAGLGRKVWANEVLSQPDLQGYLQDQTVMVFATAAARSAAIAAPSEGMVSFLLSTHLLDQYADGQWTPVVGRWVEVRSPAAYDWNVPVGATWTTAPALSGGSDATLTVPVPLGRQLDVEWAVPRITMAGATTGYLRLLGGTATIMDAVLLSTGSVAHVWPAKLTGTLDGAGVSTPIVVKPQGHVDSGAARVQGDNSGMGVRLRYRIL